MNQLRAFRTVYVDSTLGDFDTEISLKTIPARAVITEAQLESSRAKRYVADGSDGSEISDRMIHETDFQRVWNVVREANGIIAHLGKTVWMQFKEAQGAFSEILVLLRRFTGRCSEWRFSRRGNPNLSVRSRLLTRTIVR